MRDVKWEMWDVRCEVGDGHKQHAASLVADLPQQFQQLQQIDVCLPSLPIVGNVSRLMDRIRMVCHRRCKDQFKLTSSRWHVQNAFCQHFMECALSISLFCLSPYNKYSVLINTICKIKFIKQTLTTVWQQYNTELSVIKESWHLISWFRGWKECPTVEL